MNPALLRYSRYHFTDFLMHRLTVPLILLAFVAGLPTYLMTKNTPPGFMQSAQGIGLAHQMFTGSITLYLPIGAFVAAVGIISMDRQQGYFRFFFSKPISVLAYYAQTYAVNAAAYVAVFGLIVWGFSAYTVHFSVHRSMEAAALTFILMGGIGLLFGALTKSDGMLLIAVYVLATILRQIMIAPNGLSNGGLPDWVAAVAKSLPPSEKLDHLRNQLYAGLPLDMAALWHVVGYGGVAAVIGFVLLRRLPLSR